MTPCSDGFGQICTVLGSILGRISALCYCPRLSSNWCSFSIAMVMRLLKTMVLPIFLAPHHRIQLPLTSIRSSLFSHWGDGRGRGSLFSSLEAGSGEEERMDIQNCFIIAFKTKLNPTKKNLMKSHYYAVWNWALLLATEELACVHVHMQIHSWIFLSAFILLYLW